MRNCTVTRTTAETNIKLTLCLDGGGKSDINSGCGFLNHMLTLFAAHGGFDITLSCKGDTDVDFHHTVEDVGIVLGEAFYKALGDRKGIMRYGDAVLPMDEALVLTAVDISGRGMFVSELNIPTQKVGDFDTELVKEFWLAFTREAKITMHARTLAGDNSHHIIEGLFKSAAKSYAQAIAIDERRKDVLPSTKGVL